MDSDVRQWLGALCAAVAALIAGVMVRGMSEALAAALLGLGGLVAVVSLGSIAWGLLTSKPSRD